jgi:hypothetical protein
LYYESLFTPEFIDLLNTDPSKPLIPENDFYNLQAANDMESFKVPILDVRDPDYDLSDFMPEFKSFEEETPAFDLDFSMDDNDLADRKHSLDDSTISTW